MLWNYARAALLGSRSSGRLADYSSEHFPFAGRLVVDSIEGARSDPRDFIGVSPLGSGGMTKAFNMRVTPATMPILSQRAGHRP